MDYHNENKICKDQETYYLLTLRERATREYFSARRK